MQDWDRSSRVESNVSDAWLPVLATVFVAVVNAIPKLVDVILRHLRERKKPPPADRPPKEQG